MFGYLFKFSNIPLCSIIIFHVDDRFDLSENKINKIYFLWIDLLGFVSQKYGYTIFEY